jgi:hypothetical protein
LAITLASVVLASGAASQTLVDLHSVAELRAAFNNDLGKVRVILLVSPT